MEHVKEVFVTDDTYPNADYLLEPGLWCQTFLNDLGGDFDLSFLPNKAILKNKTACSGRCQLGIKSCIHMEKALSRALRTFNPQLEIWQVSCSCDEGEFCEYAISL